MRLNRFIAMCGAASRRGADKLVADGRVTVNGVAALIGMDINEIKDIVCIDGKRIMPASGNVYIMLNKPSGVISSCSDDRGRKTVIDLIGAHERIFPVGRLDYDTEGLLILTNDGDFAYRCTHPKHEVSKKYIADVKGRLDETAINSLRTGVVIDGKRTSQACVDLIERNGGAATLAVTIHEGRNRQVKKMFESIGCSVVHLKRVSIGGLELGGLPTGGFRYLDAKDIALLGADVSLTGDLRR